MCRLTKSASTLFIPADFSFLLFQQRPKEKFYGWGIRKPRDGTFELASLIIKYPNYDNFNRAEGNAEFVKQNSKSGNRDDIYENV